ncbi:RBR-type E3 ubiquitin transferase [Quillaja saponaria]|uniref:RBR-type E3 ubiquitin transferase n=1 Tax=Quillaja saponaria TaxID=32244 RepID=A0AAD7QGP2_QUISA|nr:RBR-type E3 ubiquitin transferase [Quillaja saponaria]
MATSTDTDELQTLLSEQQREFMAAKTLDSDLDMAFQLQMQEAMNASLAIQPLASRSTPSTPLKVVTYFEDDQNDGVLDLASTLMLEDLKAFAQELEDREQCEAEMRKMRDDLDRRIFDQTFARDIMNIPEDQWQNYGDNYHKPYCTDGASSSSSSSSSSSLQNPFLATEVFKLYFKGLVSEEMVKDMKVTVAAIGIAICDSKDFLIFEVKKPMEAIDADGVVLSEECAELQALIEGLDNAIGLGLKSVTFFCENYLVYNHITGRLPTSQSKLGTLVNQVLHLQTKFESCNPSLIARNDIKFAFKSARDTIVSQITWPADTNNGKSLKETCVICFEDADVEKMFSVDSCLHRYCFSCMKQHVEVKLLNGMMATCPHEGCKSEVNVDSCSKFLAPKLVEIISQRIKESAIPVTQKVYCPYPKCSVLMSKHDVLEYTKTVYIGAEQSGARKCMKCDCFFCINCQVPWHYDMTCYDYKNSNPYLRAEDCKLKSLAEENKWRQCVKCNHMVELSEGCYHIYCRCGYEFCYTCGAEWKNKKATCSCPIWDEPNIIRNQRRF